MLNEERFKEIFGCYNVGLQEIVLNKLYDPEAREVLGLDVLETKALRDYLGIDVSLTADVNIKAGTELPTMAKVSRKAMCGVMRQSHFLEIADAENQLSQLMDITDEKQLQKVSNYTTGELMNMYGVAAYPLIRACKSRGIYPLPDLTIDGFIRPFYNLEEANFSVRVANTLKRSSRTTSQFGYKYRSMANLAYLIAEDEEQLLKFRGMGPSGLAEIAAVREVVKAKYPEHYERLTQLIKEMQYGSYEYPYFEAGSKEEFEAFKKECKLRQLINIDDEECLRKTEGFTPSELRMMYGEAYDVLEQKCKRLGIYPLPEMDSMGNVTPRYLLGCAEGFSRFGMDREQIGVKYAHELFALNNEELHGVLSKLVGSDRKRAEEFIEKVKTRYPEHVEKIKEIRVAKERAKEYHI